MREYRHQRRNQRGAGAPANCCRADGRHAEKKQNSVTLRVDGGGPAGILLAVADGAGHVKGYVQKPFAEMPPRRREIGRWRRRGQGGHAERGERPWHERTLYGPYPLVSGEIGRGYYAVLCGKRTDSPPCAHWGCWWIEICLLLCAGGYLIQLCPGPPTAK